MGRRLALLVATYDYEDTGLRRLTTPAHDAEAFAAVLQDPDIAGFEVTTLINEPHYRVGEAISDLYRERRRDDLTLLYFTGHGLKDDDGRLYLATANTRRSSLLFTSLPAEQIDQAMSGSMSRRNVLILDCCYSGAFPAGRTKGDTDVHTLERFQGRGRTVLTASDATQYSFEGNQPQGEAAQSVFTRYLVAGLRDGSADLDGDGDITIDELYSFVHDRVVDEMPQQRPKKQDNVEGRIVIARNVNWSLPAHLRNAIDSPIANARIDALDGLARLYRIGNETVRGTVLEEIRRLATDDSRGVSAAAAAQLQFILPVPLQTPGEPTASHVPDAPQPTILAPSKTTGAPPGQAPQTPLGPAPGMASDGPLMEPLTADTASPPPPHRLRALNATGPERAAAVEPLDHMPPTPRHAPRGGTVQGRPSTTHEAQPMPGTLGGITPAPVPASTGPTAPADPGHEYSDERQPTARSTTAGSGRDAVVAASVPQPGDSTTPDRAAAHVETAETPNHSSALPDRTPATPQVAHSPHPARTRRRALWLGTAIVVALATISTITALVITWDPGNSHHQPHATPPASASQSHTPSPSPTPPLHHTWAYTTGNMVFSSPAVVGGIVYVGSDDGKVYALDAATGTRKWAYATGNTVSSSPAVVGGIVYVGSYDGKVYALDAATGTRKWAYATGLSVYSSPAVVGGIVYVGSYGGKVYALDAATGTRKWAYATGLSVYSSPAVVGGIVYVGSNDGKVYALDAATGAQRWAYATGGAVGSDPAVVGGIVYIGSGGGKVYALDAATGARKWAYATGDTVSSAPAVVGGIVYIGSGDGKVYALDAATGTRKWAYATGDTVSSAPAVVGGIVYIGSGDGKVYALDAATGTRKWAYATGLSVYSSPAVADGTVYVGSLDGKVYALDAATGTGPAG